jgi:hypothetical protein
VRITIYRQPDDYISHNFLPKELDSVKELCYINNIKFYVLSYTEQEMSEYEGLSKRNY